MNDQLRDDLAALREPAPASLLPGILIATGLADGYITHASPIGPLFVAFNEHGVSAIDVAGDPDAFEGYFAERFGRPVHPAAALPREIAGRLDKAIAEGRPGNLPLDLSSVTPFQAKVLLKTAEIPRGEVRPYGWVAGEINNPSATRAVGSALARNPVPVVVPCHRVVASEGLGGFGAGPGIKRGLLALEGRSV